MAVSRLCPGCRDRWPEPFKRCPVCERTTMLVGQEPNRSTFDAREAEFERWYAEREQRRMAEGELAPEGLGRRQAQAMIAEMDELERRLR